jgi:hypothetical protein
MLQGLKRVFNKKPYLNWYVRDHKSLSSESVLESVLNYGDWQDFLDVKETLGLRKTMELFEDIKGKKRINLRPATLNYFNKYFNKYA